MALTNSTHTSAKYVKLFAGKKNEKPYFGLKGGKDVNYKVISEHDTMDGYIKSVELGSFVFEGETKDTVKLTFTDADNELFVVEGNLNTSIMKSLLNTIAGLPELAPKLVMKLYVNKNDFPSLYITDSNNNRLDWKYPLDKLPKPIAYTTPSGKEEFDSANVIAWYKKLITDEIIPSLGTPKFENKSLPDIKDVPTPERANVSGGNGMSQEQSDDLPF
jgi:hypothetical protein